MYWSTVLKAFLALGRATDRANLYPLQYFKQSITVNYSVTDGQTDSNPLAHCTETAEGISKQ